MKNANNLLKSPIPQ